MIQFRVIVPVYNADKWISKCLDSLINQDYENWKAIIIDDNSLDKTLDEIKKVIRGSKVKEQFKVFARTSNVGALENIVYGIANLCEDDEEIVVLLDGDDWLFDNTVLSYLNEVYTKENNWMTYGSFISKSGAHNGFCKPLKNTEDYRKSVWVTSHLRTYKYWLWKMIKNEDLKDISGKFYSMAWDMAIMYPLIEMSGIDKIRFIEKLMYVYNDQNPINDFRKNVLLQLSIAKEIKNKAPYERIKYR